jgi:predicted nuclease with TOPRIM domain
LDFSFPENILNFDEKFCEFQEKYLLIKYVYYNLTKNLEIINNMTNIESENEFINLSINRLNFSKNDLEKNITILNEKLEHFNKLIITKLV